MYPWLPWMSAFARQPFGGDVSQAISPLTNWFSPTIEFDFAGDQHIEADIVANVASYGRQLGAITDAVLALARDDTSPPVTRLKDLAEQIEASKRRRRKSLEEDAKRSLETLRKTDLEAFLRVLQDYQRRFPSG